MGQKSSRGPIYSIDQMFEDGQVKHLGIAQDVSNDEDRHIQLVGQPVTLSRAEQDGGPAAGIRRAIQIGVVGQFDCGRLPHWKTDSARAIFAGWKRPLP